MTFREFIKTAFAILTIIAFMVVIWFGLQVSCDLAIGKEICWEIGEED